MRDAHSAASSRLLAAAAHDGLQQRHGCNMQGHGRVTAESWVIGEILPLSCLRRKKKSFVIATEKGCSLFVLGEREREMVITGLERNMHLRQRGPICRIPISNGSADLHHKSLRVLNACFAPIRSI